MWEWCGSHCVKFAYLLKGTALIGDKPLNVNHRNITKKDKIVSLEVT